MIKPPTVSDVDPDPISQVQPDPSQAAGIKPPNANAPSTAADILAEVEAEQTALHVAVVGLLAEAREREHLAVLVHWLLARVTA